MLNAIPIFKYISSDDKILYSSDTVEIVDIIINKSLYSLHTMVEYKQTMLSYR